MGVRYYSILRPVSMGTFPEPEDNPILQISNFNQNKFVDDIGRNAWGFIVYKKVLPDQLVSMFDLVRSRPGEEDKAVICRRLCKTLQLTRMCSDLIMIGYDPEKEIVTLFFQDHSLTVNVAADSGIAMIEDIVNAITE